MTTETIIIRLPKPRNPIAKELRTAKYRQRVVKPKKGKGSFSRTDQEVVYEK